MRETRIEVPIVPSASKTATGEIVEGWQWGFDRASNRTWRKNLVAVGGQDEAYGYDGLYQVIRDAVGTLNTNRTGVGGTPRVEEDFAYDPVGNWLGYRKDEDGDTVLDQTRSNNRDNQLVQIDGNSDLLEYDKAGNALKVPPGTGGDWNKCFKPVWDAWNRLTEVKDENGATVQKNAYDGLFRRITKESGGVVVHTYWSARWKPLEERIDSGTTAVRSYVWGERPGHRDELVLRDRDTEGNETLDERLYATMDYFSGTAVLDTSGVVQERYAYSAFGIRRIMATDFSGISSSLFAWDFGFQGQFEDVQTGWCNYGYRFYASVVGRWVNRDPIDEKGGVNLYRSSGNNCLNIVDIFGLKSCSSEIVAGHGGHIPGSPLENLIDSIEKNMGCGDRVTAVGCFSGDINDRTPNSVVEGSDQRWDPEIPNHLPGGIPNPEQPGYLWQKQAYADLHGKVVAAMNQAEADCGNPQTNEEDQECPCTTVTVRVNCQGGSYPQFREMLPPAGRPPLCNRSWKLTCKNRQWSPARL